MDSLDLLAREDEFKKLNKQLEKKTESLMKEIEHVMQKPDFFSEISHNLSLTPLSTPKKHICSPPQETTPPKPTFKRKTLKSPKPVNVDENKCVEVAVKENDIVPDEGRVKYERVVCDCCDRSKTRKTDNEQFLQAFVSVGVQEKVFPPSFLKDNISVENICKFLSTKVKLMQEQIDKLQTTLDKKAVQCKAHLTHQAELEGERMSLLNQNNNLKSAAADAKAKSMALENRLADEQIAYLMEKDRLYQSQRSECDKLSSELQRAQSALGTSVARHRAATTALEAGAKRLADATAQHEEFRESSRQLSISYQQTITALEARVTSLMSTIDKQSSLIDNLRRQNAIMSAGRSLAAEETKYWRLLTDAD